MAKRPPLTDTQKAKKKNGICVTAYCTKTRAKHRSYCYSCLTKMVKAKDPLKYTYGVKRRNARRKKKYFDLTLDQFKEFAEKNDYMKKKGTSAKSMQIDRDKECVASCPIFCKEHGYTYKNIQAITLTENRYKYTQHKRAERYKDVPF